MKSPVVIISLTVIAVAVIGGTVALVVTGHDGTAIINLITTGSGLFAATYAILTKQQSNEKAIATVAKSVNGNTSTLINAAIASGSLDPETLQRISDHNDTLLPIAANAPDTSGPITPMIVTSGDGGVNPPN